MGASIMLAKLSGNVSRTAPNLEQLERGGVHRPAIERCCREWGAACS